MRVRFACPSCDLPVSPEEANPARWRCSCGVSGDLNLAESATGKPLHQCAVCGCNQLFRQKNFPQWLGLTLLTVACSAFFILQLLYFPKLAWAILLGSAAFDLVLYLLVGDVVVCYRCGARHLGLPRRNEYDPFELTIAEKYRQERIRRELQAQESAAGKH